jgi:putative ABC transport system permease protein
MALSGFTIIRRSLLGRMFSTVTTAVTVAVAVALLLLLLSMRASAERAFQRGIGNMHLLVSNEPDRLGSVLHAIYYTQAPTRFVTWEEYQSIASRYGGGSSRPGALSFLIPIQQGDSYRGFPVTATTPEFFTQFSHDFEFAPGTPESEQPGEPWRLGAGRFFDGDFQAVLGSEAAARTGLSVGDHIHIAHGASEFDHEDRGHVHDEFEWEIVGILQETGSAHDRALFIDIGSAWIVHAHDRRERDADGHIHTDAGDVTNEDRKITGLLLRAQVRPGRQMSTATGPIAFELNQLGLTVAEPRLEVDRLFRIVGNVSGILLGMAIVVMVSSGIAIMLALYNSMEQRRRQIATFRVLGASKARIFSWVMAESAVLGFLGALAGIALWAPASIIVSGIMEAKVGLSVGLSLNPITLIPVMAGSIVLGCLAGVVPAIAGYRTPVAVNLRPIG